MAKRATSPLLFQAPIPENWMNFVIIFLSLTFACAGISVLIGVVSSSSRMTVLWSQLIFVPSMLLGGLMLPYSMLPAIAGKFAQLLPATHAMNAFHGLAMGIQADFIESDIMEAAQVVKSRHDIVFSSTGVLCWIPDIKVYARTVRGLLKEDGFFYLFDGHPFRHVLLDSTGSFGTTIQGDYFRKEAWEYPEMGDYTDPELKLPVKNYEWDWTLGEVVTAFCEAGLRIEFLHEFPQYFYNGYTPYDIQEEKVELFPCTFSLKASAG